MIQTDDGGYAIVGYIGMPFLNFPCDAWLVKTDANGNMQWDQTYGGASIDLGFCVIQNSYGEYVIAGYTNSSGVGNYDALLLKIGASGNVVSSITYGGPEIDTCRSVVQTSDGAYIIGGTTASFGAGSNDFWLIKTSAPPAHIHNINTGLNYILIQDAIDAPETQNGHTISVDSGIYLENIVVNKSVKLRGENPASTIIDGRNSGNVLSLDANNVEVSGFTIQNSGSSSSGIYAAAVTGANISYNIINTNYNGAVAIEDSSLITLSSNRIVSDQFWFGDALGIYDSNVDVANCDLQGYSSAYGDSTVSISDSTVSTLTAYNNANLLLQNVNATTNMGFYDSSIVTILDSTMPYMAIRDSATLSLQRANVTSYADCYDESIS